MPRRARAMPPVISIWARGLAQGLARGFALACGLALAGTLLQAPGGGAPSWPSWSRPALAQDVGAQLQPPELQRLAGPLPYRPGGPDSGWLSETDLARAVDLIADLGLFLAKLSESDPDTQARLVWGRGDAAYGAAAKDLRAANEDGQFRIIISEGSSLAITRRGEEIWVDSDLAGAWNVKRVRRARWQGDDWPDIAALSALLFDLWRGQETEASGAWLDHQLDSLAVSRAAFEKGGTGAAAVFTRYGFLKDLFFKASLLRDATAAAANAANAANAAPWRNRAQRIQQQTDMLLRSVATTGLGGELAVELRDHWAAYATEIEESSGERSGLLLAALRPAPAPARAGAVPRNPEQEPGAEESIAEETATEETAAEETAAETGPPQAANVQARDQDYIALLLARTVDAARTAEEAERQADTMARQAGAAILAAEQARDALVIAQTGSESTAEETARLRQQAAQMAAELAAERDQARNGEAALRDRLTQAEDRAKAAEAVAAKSAAEATDLEARLAAAQAGSESTAEETARLRRQAAEMAAEMAVERDQARSGEAALRDRLTQAEGQASAAEAAAAKSAAEAAEAITGLQGQLAARDADLTRAEAQAATRTAALAEAGAEIGRLESRLETLQAAVAEADIDRTALAAAESERTALETRIEARQAELAAERSRAESAAEETAVALDRERARATELDVTLAEARQTLVAAQERAQAQTARAAQAEAAAAAAGATAQTAQQDLAARDEELASLREEVRALRQEIESQVQTPVAPAPPSRVPTWLEDWLAPIVAAALLAGGVVVLLAVSRRRAPVHQPVRQPVREADQGATEAQPASAPDIREPVEQTPAKERPSKQRPTARHAAARHPQAAAVTSASIVGAVRRQDWATAEAQFAQLSGVSAPRLRELLSDPSGELLALACRAADLDRLTFAALYLLQGQGRAVADPEVVAGAVGFFEKTGPAEAQRILAERRDRDSLSA